MQVYFFANFLHSGKNFVKFCQFAFLIGSVPFIFNNLWCLLTVLSVLDILIQLMCCAVLSLLMIWCYSCETRPLLALLKKMPGKGQASKVVRMVFSITRSEDRRTRSIYSTFCAKKTSGMKEMIAGLIFYRSTTLSHMKHFRMMWLGPHLQRTTPDESPQIPTAATAYQLTVWG